MKKYIHISAIAIMITSIFQVTCTNDKPTSITEEYPAKEVLKRVVGNKNAKIFNLQLDTSLQNEYTISVVDNKVNIKASSQISMCRAAYDYLRNRCNSIVSWSGNSINIPGKLPDYTQKVKSPYKYRYYFNVVTHGYTTAYWDWERWQKEIDWMAMHGLNMPLLSGAHEAILLRVFKKLGMSDQDINTYFTGPAHFPWNKMGNITAWNGNIPGSYFKKQIELNHKILRRLKDLQMKAIIPAFAGFVPKAIKNLYPDEQIRELNWGGFEDKHHAYILEPGSKLFIKIGKMYIEEYEKEFGKQEFYLADSFNEMKVPISNNHKKALDELSNYGLSIYNSINQANGDAVWVMQAWTFPYQKVNGKLFWTPDRLNALVSKIPDDKLLLLDLANEYNRLIWNIKPSWKMYKGFFGKMWIYSFIPNMGGKTAMNGRLDLYASMASEALNYNNKGNMVGFGFAPEGIENNEIIYELLSDVAWTDKAIDLNKWIDGYAKSRYGACPESMTKAFQYFNKSCYSSFTDHPRNTYQFRPSSNIRGTVDKSAEIAKGIKFFLASKDSITHKTLYKVDAIEYVSQYLGLKADSLIAQFKQSQDTDKKLLDSALRIINNIDRLLMSHPNWKLSNWTNYARSWGDNDNEKQYYESNARRLITTWGGGINEYAAKTWSGLIRDYYVPRWNLYYKAKENKQDFDIMKWEEEWINSTKISKIKPYDNALEAAEKLFYKYQ